MIHLNLNQENSPPKTIGLDLKTFTLQNAGIGRYTINLVQELIKRDRHSYIGFLSPRTDRQQLKSCTLKTAQGLSSRFNSTIFRSLVLVPFQIKKENIDLFHSMDNSTIHQLPFTRCKRLSTIHDAIVFRHPEFFTKKHAAIVQKMMAFTADNADHIIVDSFSTKKDLLEVFSHLKDQNVSVIHLAASDIFNKSSKTDIDAFVRKYHLPKRYFLSLATQEPRKNLKNLIEAFRQLKQKSSFDDIGLVLVGGKGWLASGTENTQKKEGIFHLGFLEDKLLPQLYSGALAFVYPSFYEGFGLPVLEAMSCGQPIITSWNSSIPEVAGESAIYIDPHSTASIRSALQQITDSTKLQGKLAKEALIKSKEFSWKKTAEQTEAVYNKLLN